MTRVKRGFVLRKRHKKIIKMNSGFVGSHSKLFKVANQENLKSLSYAYKDRKKKKRNFKSLWIKKINSTIKYNIFINNLKKNELTLNRKILAKICENDRITIEKIKKSILK